MERYSEDVINKFMKDERLKKDYDFVKLIIDKYKDDPNFICAVADSYLDEAEDELSRMELAITMADLMRKKDDKKYQEYNVISDAMYNAKRLNIEMARIEIKDENVLSKLGMGFLVIFDSFNSSKIVLDFYAKKLIEEIFREYDINLEEMLHQQFNNPNEIDKKGINNYMLNFIRNYDSMLADYLSTNIDLLESFASKIKTIQDEWNNYDNTRERKRYNMMFLKVHEYLEQNKNEGILTETDLLYYIGKDLGIISKIVKYDGINSLFAEEIVEELDDEFLNDTLKMSFVDLLHYNNVKKIMSVIAFSNHYEEILASTKKSNCKLIRLNLDK